MTVVNIIAQLPVSNNIAQLPGLAPHGRIAAHGETNKCECGSLAPPPPYQPSMTGPYRPSITGWMIKSSLLQHVQELPYWRTALGVNLL